MSNNEQQGVILAAQNSPCPTASGGEGPASAGPWRPRRGRKPLAPADRREHPLFVRVNLAELAKLDQLRGTRTRGDALRSLALGQAAPVQVPEINVRVRAELARASSNLNQIAARLGAKRPVELDEIAKTLAQFRAALIGR